MMEKSPTYKKEGIGIKGGVIDFFGERIVLVPPNIINLLSSIYGEGAKSLLNFLGKKMGRRMAENWDEMLKPNSLRQLTTIFCQYLSASGFGHFEPNKIEEKEIEIRVNHSIAGEMEPLTKHICYFLNGMMLGFGEFALYRAKVDEIECTVDTHKDSCLFSIKKKAWTLLASHPATKTEN